MRAVIWAIAACLVFAVEPSFAQFTPTGGSSQDSPFTCSIIEGQEICSCIGEDDCDYMEYAGVCDQVVTEPDGTEFTMSDFECESFPGYPHVCTCTVGLRSPVDFDPRPDNSNTNDEMAPQPDNVRDHRRSETVPSRGELAPTGRDDVGRAPGRSETVPARRGRAPDSTVADPDDDRR